MWHLGPLPIRAYALCIIVGIVVAIVGHAAALAERGGEPDHVWDVAGWAIVFGIIGGRLYHVITDPELYFRAGRATTPSTRSRSGTAGWASGGRSPSAASAPGSAAVAAASAAPSSPTPSRPASSSPRRSAGWGNWFNNELYGGPTSLPWGLQIHCLDIDGGHAVAGGAAYGGEHCHGERRAAGLYQPTFLYEIAVGPRARRAR